MTARTARPGPDDWGERIFETIATGQHYRLSVPAIGLVCDLDRLRRDRGDLTNAAALLHGLTQPESDAQAQLGEAKIQKGSRG